MVSLVKRRKIEDGDEENAPDKSASGDSGAGGGSSIVADNANDGLRREMNKMRNEIRKLRKEMTNNLR